MSSYVPPHLRNRAPHASSTPSVSGSSPSRTFGSASSTMASLTRHTGKASSSVAPTISDFPVLSQAVDVSQPKQQNQSNQSNQSVWSNNKSFAALSRDWGVHQKEQEEQEKRRAKEKLTQEQLDKEKKDKELSYYCVGVVNSTRLIYGISQNEKEEQKNGRYDDDGDMSPVEDDSTYDDDEDETKEVDADWNYRRSKNDLY